MFKLIPFYSYKVCDSTLSNVYETKKFQFGILALISFIQDSKKYKGKFVTLMWDSV